MFPACKYKLCKRGPDHNLSINLMKNHLRLTKKIGQILEQAYANSECEFLCKLIDNNIGFPQ